MFFPFPSPRQQGGGSRPASPTSANGNGSKPPSAKTKTNGLAKATGGHHKHEQSDSELMSQVCAGDDDAVRALWDRYGSFVFQAALRILKDRGEAQEIVQETFWKLCRVAARFDAVKGTFSRWLIRITANAALKRRQYLEARQFYNTAAIEEVEADLLVCGDDFQLASQEKEYLVYELLSQLKRAQRRAIELKCGEGMTAKEGAVSTGESTSSFENHFYRGLSKLKDLVREKPR